MNRKEQEQFIFGSIFLLANKLQIEGDKLIDDITLKQWFVLIMIKNQTKDKLSVSNISEIMGTSRQNIRKIINILDKKKYVITKKDVQDKRNLLVSLTEKTFELFESQEDLGNDFLDFLFLNFSSEQIKQTVSVLSGVLNIIEKERFSGSEK